MREAHAGAHLHGDERQGDGNAQAPLEHVVQAAVARVVVVVGIAAEALLGEEELSEPMEDAQLVAEADGTGACRQLVELLERVLEDEVRMLDTGDAEGAPRQVDVGLGRANQLGEGAGGVHQEVSQQPGAWWIPAPASA